MSDHAWHVVRNTPKETGFVGAGTYTGPDLSPGVLVERLAIILEAAARYLPQFAPEQLEANVRERKRSLGVLGHHVFRIPEAFLECVRGGVALSYDALTAPPPDGVRTGEEIARIGRRIRADVLAWWAGEPDANAKVETYYGPQTVHELLERTTWHSGQHVRQILMVLDDSGLEPDGLLGPEVFEGLPMPRDVWDG